jgi:hypothetical protein
MTRRRAPASALPVTRPGNWPYVDLQDFLRQRRFPSGRSRSFGRTLMAQEALVPFRSGDQVRCTQRQTGRGSRAIDLQTASLHFCRALADVEAKLCSTALLAGLLLPVRRAAKNRCEPMTPFSPARPPRSRGRFSSGGDGPRRCTPPLLVRGHASAMTFPSSPLTTHQTDRPTPVRAGPPPRKYLPPLPAVRLSAPYASKVHLSSTTAVPQPKLLLLQALTPPKAPDLPNNRTNILPRRS